MVNLSGIIRPLTVTCMCVLFYFNSDRVFTVPVLYPGDNIY